MTFSLSRPSLKASAFGLPLVCAAALAAAPAGAEMTLVSPDIAPDTTIGADHVFDGFGCTGPNLSPALEWSGAPEGTNSYILTVHDPDAPTGSGFWRCMPQRSRNVTGHL